MADSRDIEMIAAYGGNPQVGHLSTPISDSAFTRAFIGNLPAYRKGLSASRRGLEIGMAHGYFLYGPFLVLGPLRETELANLAGLLATIGLISILTIALSLHGAADVKYPPVESATPSAPSNLWDKDGWGDFASSFFLGACGGAFFAYFLCLTPHLAPLQEVVNKIWSVG
ncbi:photosystem I reaction center subunit XI [Roseofilum sp. BLCC_M91]|uniref:Photosystem I reaction center subunit XI n=1 Tax=Roseofilum halophilum BLCC-M91 TaxID=3022259 RepID=A0ABT7BE06_9CYAN|nr:photosystem I reaction center subunit XI [Roseofilum halophilum]MDJ1177400.1 photosystem I reaction center subunit XI [Roseofilum halophilum BLCC-M91]